MIRYLLVLLLLSSCSGHRDLGECIGVVDEGDPKLVYETDVRNTVWSVIAFQTLIAPILWATDYAKCPIRRK